MDQACDPGSRPDLWAGAVAWTSEETGWQAWRLPPEEEATAYAAELYVRARMAAGVRLAATVQAERLRAELSLQSEESTPVDILIDGELVERVPVEAATSIDVELPQASCQVEVWLPQFGEVQVTSIQFTGAESVEATPRGPRWIIYGSSITHCRSAEGPSETWPALVSRALGWDLTCLGFGGQCHLDPVVARTIAGLDAEVIAMCLGINIYGGGTFAERTLPGQLAGFVRGVRESHPDSQLVMISPIFSPGREDTANRVDLTLSQIRAMVHRIHGDFTERGDTKLHVVDGLSVVGADDAHVLFDDLHPDAAGYKLMAERLAPQLGAVL